MRYFDELKNYKKWIKLNLWENIFNNKNILDFELID